MGGVECITWSVGQAWGSGEDASYRGWRGGVKGRRLLLLLDKEVRFKER